MEIFETNVVVSTNAIIEMVEIELYSSKLELCNFHLKLFILSHWRMEIESFYVTITFCGFNYKFRY